LYKLLGKRLVLVLPIEILDNIKIKKNNDIICFIYQNILNNLATFPDLLIHLML
jgi:hypothetical protein